MSSAETFTHIASLQDNPLLAVIDGDAIDQLSANDVRLYRRGNLSATSRGYGWEIDWEQ